MNIESDEPEDIYGIPSNRLAELLVNKARNQHRNAKCVYEYYPDLLMKYITDCASGNMEVIYFFQIAFVSTNHNFAITDVQSTEADR